MSKSSIMPTLRILGMEISTFEQSSKSHNPNLHHLDLQNVTQIIHEIIGHILVEQDCRRVEINTSPKSPLIHR